MSKKALLAQMSSKFDSQAAAERAIDAVVDGILAEVSAGGKIILHGFGTFKQKRKSARNARNPRTGETIAVQEKIVLQFDTKITF